VCCRRGLIWPSAGLDYGTSKAVALNGCIKIFVYLGLGALAVRRKDCLAAYRCEDTGQLFAKQLQAACLLVCAASLKQKAARSHAYPLLRRAELAFLAAAVSEGGSHQDRLFNDAMLTAHSLLAQIRETIDGPATARGANVI
jgi:hypothetical protein